MNDLTVQYFVLYGVVAIAICTYLARTLSASGGIFLKDVFDDAETAEALNRLLVIGFLLLNIGYAMLIVNTETITGAAQFAQKMSKQFGLLVGSLGIIHFVNLAVFWKLRRRNEIKTMQPPIPPQGWSSEAAPSWQHS